jgi:hypothetical protein
MKFLALAGIFIAIAGCAEGAAAPDGSGCRSSSDCDDLDRCTQDMCDITSGLCSHKQVCCQGAADCDDGKPCTDDSCVDGMCKHTMVGGCCAAATDCDDGNSCTTDSCVSNQCQTTPIAGCCSADSQCDDSNVCTMDVCMAMACMHNPVEGCCNVDGDCNDSDLCTTDTCAANHSCSHTPVAGCCRSDADCNDGNVCTMDTCDSVTHTCPHTPVSGCCNADSDCNDSDACTTDTCNVNHQCVHNPVPGCCNTNPQCDDGNVCTNDTCNTTTHLCAHTGVAGCCTMNSQCDDHNVCNGVETCMSSTCMPGTALNCDDANACTADSCDPVNGCQHTAVNCNDSNACTVDTCDTAAGCQHTPVGCDDGDLCTTDGCDAASGCTHAAVPNCAARPNDLCANAIDITNMTVIGGSTLGAHNESEPSCVSTAGQGGADVYYKFTLTQTEVVYLDTFGSEYDTVVYLLNGCGGTAVANGCQDDSGCSAPDFQHSQLAVTLPAGTYIVVVDSYGYSMSDTRWMGGAFTLNFRHSGPNCSGASRLTSGTRTSSDTCTGVASQNGSCTSAAGSGKEHTYYFLECPGTHALDATTCDATTTALDSVLYVKYGDCNGGDIACNDDTATTCSATADVFVSHLTTTLQTGGIYYLMVDTYGTKACGPYGLTATF